MKLPSFWDESGEMGRQSFLLIKMTAGFRIESLYGSFPSSSKIQNIQEYEDNPEEKMRELLSKHQLSPGKDEGSEEKKAQANPTLRVSLVQEEQRKTAVVSVVLVAFAS